jgi:RimJ/RimL family protein N-acetyltransferase
VIRLPERNGFERTGLFREYLHWNGEFLDSAVYARLAAP